VKVAFVKQLLDTHGPWASVRWQETSPLELLDVWPGRALFWAMTVLLQADWYVVPQRVTTWYTLFSGIGRPPDRDVLERHTWNIVAPCTIPYDEYDVVISLDPCLQPPRCRQTLLAYYMNEHVDVRYGCSKRRPAPGYDLFFAHLLDATPTLNQLPQALGFPYMWERDITRPLLRTGPPAEEAVLVEWRTLALLLGDRSRQGRRFTQQGQASSIGLTDSEAQELANRLAFYLDRPVRFQLLRDGIYNRLPDPPRWGDTLTYLRSLAGCRYYASLFSFGAGQALVDAAAAGAIVFGSGDLAYHRLVCHPSCLCTSLKEFPEQFRHVSQSADLQKEILVWQDRALRHSFRDEPLALLAQAVEMKKAA